MNIMFDNICEIICQGEHVSLMDIKRETRKQEILYPRQLIMYFAKEFKALPADRLIGEPFGKDHATVISSHKAIRNYIDTDKVKREQIKNYREKLTGVKEIIAKSEVLKEELRDLQHKISLAEQRLATLHLIVSEVNGLIEKYKL
jgi:hypothetical protein